MRLTRWLLAALVVVLIGAAVVGYIAGRQGLPQSSGAASPSSSAEAEASSPPPSGDAGGVAGSAPTGCLGGPNRDADMVLTTQKKAAHTPYGAVEVAASLFRWAIQEPEPTTADVRDAAPIFVASHREAAQRQLIADYRANPNPSNGLVPDGERFYLSTVNGRWLISAGGTENHLTVGIEAPFVIDGALSPTKSLTESFELTWEGGAWRLNGLARGDAERLAAGGTQFTAGC